MRYVLSAILVFALGAPAGLALPTISASTVSLSHSDMVVAVAKRSSGGSKSASSSAKSSKSAKSKKDDGGIHPLVGSGDY